MVMTPLRAALVGCGRIGAHTADHLRTSLPAGWLPLSHAEALQSLPDFELVAVCDVDPARATEVAQRFGVSRVFSDYRQMIRDVRPDILTIATRTEGRCDILVFAAENGVRGIHAEKPLGRSLGECRRALRAAAQYNVKLSYGATRRCMEIYRRAREWVASGRIGTLQHVTVEVGRTLLLWNHPHTVDLLLFFSGADRVEYLQASCEMPAACQRVVDADPILENAFVKFSNGVGGSLTAMPGVSLRLGGTTGSVTVGANGAWLECETIPDTHQPYRRRYERSESQPPFSGTQQALRELARAVRENGDGPITAREIELGCNILLGCAYSSWEGGRRIRPQDVPEDFTVTGKFGELYA
jgi:predicted dehydrogenase